MALLDLNFYSYILGMDCSAYVLLPGKRMHELTDRSSKRSRFYICCTAMAMMRRLSLEKV